MKIHRWDSGESSIIGNISSLRNINLIELRVRAMWHSTANFLSFDYSISFLLLSHKSSVSSDTRDTKCTKCLARDSEPANIASVPLRSFGKLVIRRNGSWVKSQLSDRGTDSHTATMGYSSGIQCV